ncbi:MAG: hypothetical protein LLG01_01415 [Planctomycetaceae bacterium]|nr:hypothetical protein [Planctomycetaceae bacterium]
MKELLETLSRHFDFLFSKYQFQFVESNTDNMGTSYVVLAGRGLRIWFDKHRGELTVAVWPVNHSDKERFELITLREYLAAVPARMPTDETVGDLAKWLDDNLDAVCDALCTEHYARTCSEIKIILDCRWQMLRNGIFVPCVIVAVTPIVLGRQGRLAAVLDTTLKEWKGLVRKKDRPSLWARWKNRHGVCGRILAHKVTIIKTPAGLKCETWCLPGTMRGKAGVSLVFFQDMNRDWLRPGSRVQLLATQHVALEKLISLPDLRDQDVRLKDRQELDR